MIKYKKLTKKELNIFIEMRINQLREEGANDDTDLYPVLNDYYNKHMPDGTFDSWLAMDDTKIVGTSGISFVEKPPYFGCTSGKMGILSSMFTDKNYRRDDREGPRDLMVNQSGLTILGDKGYVGETPSQEMKEQGICLMALKRSNSKTNWPRPVRQLIFRQRRRAETVFSQLSVQLNAEKVNYQRDCKEKVYET